MSVSIASRKTLYPATAVLSLDAVQEKVTVVSVILSTIRFAGIDGASVSSGKGVTTGSFVGVDSGVCVCVCVGVGVYVGTGVSVVCGFMVSTGNTSIKPSNFFLKNA